MPKNKLTMENSWEFYAFYVDSKEITDLSEVEIEGYLYPVTRISVTNSYSDHGHTHTVQSPDYTIEEEVFGTTFVFKLSDLIQKLDITATAWIPK